MRTDRVVSEVLGEEHALSPSDLYNAALKTNLVFGYSKDQVDTLLERAADVLETLITKNRQLKQQIDEQKEELEMFRNVEESLRSALVSSQKMSENIIASARFQADALLEEAKLANAQAVFNMEQLPDALQTEIHRLMDARDRLRDDIAALLKTHEDLLGRIPRAEDMAGEFVREAAKRRFAAQQEPAFAEAAMEEEEPEGWRRHDNDGVDDIRYNGDALMEDTTAPETPKEADEYDALQ